MGLEPKTRAGELNIGVEVDSGGRRRTGGGDAAGTMAKGAKGEVGRLASAIGCSNRRRDE